MTVLSSYAVDQVYPLLSSVAVKKFKDIKQTNSNPDEYIVINSLPITGNHHQHCYVNVNVHVKELGPGIPNRTREAEIANTVLGLLEKKTTSTLIIDFEGEETIKDERLSERFVNLRFYVRIKNN